jgi:5-methylcytosine-specific restriction endonuclease McrA
MIETKTDIKNIKKAYKEIVGECEDCGKKTDLEVHRITPGYKGGTYIPRNCQVLCKECHKLRAEVW